MGKVIVAQFRVPHGLPVRSLRILAIAWIWCFFTVLSFQDNKRILAEQGGFRPVIPIDSLAYHSIMLAFLHTAETMLRFCEQTGEEAYFIHSALYTNAIL